VINDITQLQLREVDSTGTLNGGDEKVLTDLRKRKLISQKYAR
jgi:phenylalanyl-tRNA synthetase alpha chain